MNSDFFAFPVSLEKSRKNEIDCLNDSNLKNFLKNAEASGMCPDHHE